MIVLVGDLDFSNVPEVRRTLEEAGTDSIIDVPRVSYIDAGIINEFVRFAKRTRPQVITLRGASPHIRRLIALLNLETMFSCSEEAGAFRARSGLPARLHNIHRQDVAVSDWASGGV